MSERLATVERQVKQLSNDVNDIYGMLANIQRTQRAHTGQLDSVENKVDGIAETVQNIAKGLSDN